MPEPHEPDEPIEVPIEDSLDLHTIPPRETKAVVEAYLEEAAALGFTEVRIIHGRGIGTQREITRSVLKRSELVQEFWDAPPSRGGWGATVAVLRQG